MVSPAAADARPLWIDLDRVLATANWSRVDPSGLAIGDPPAGIPIDAPPGVTIVGAESNAAVLGPAIFTLAEVLGATGILVTTTFTNQKRLKKDQA